MVSPWCLPVCVISGTEPCRPGLATKGSAEPGPVTTAHRLTKDVSRRDQKIDSAVWVPDRRSLTLACPGRRDIYPRQQREPGHKEQHQRRHAGLLAFGYRRHDADQQGPDKRGHFSGQCEQAEILRDAVFWRELNEKRPRRGLQRAADGSDQTSQQEISALGGSGEQGAARNRRRDCDK